jgi:hypothetical protein
MHLRLEENWMKQKIITAQVVMDFFNFGLAPPSRVQGLSLNPFLFLLQYIL